MNKTLRAVAWVQILGGVATAGYVVLLLVVAGVAGPLAFVGPLLIVLGVLSAFAGALLLRAGRGGWLCSVLLQLIQLPALSLGTAMYRLGLGAFLALGFHLPEIGERGGNIAAHVQFGLGTEFMTSFGRALEEQYIAVNVVAFALVIALLRSRPATWPKKGDAR
jgi:hypothetical protein